MIIYWPNEVFFVMIETPSTVRRNVKSCGSREKFALDTDRSYRFFKSFIKKYMYLVLNESYENVHLAYVSHQAVIEKLNNLHNY